MASTNIKAKLIWISTDCEGRIDEISALACELLGVPSRGQHLTHFFPLHERELALDIEAALTGVASRRRALLEPQGRRPIVAVEYVVGPRFKSDNVGLYWFLELIAVENPEETLH
jgi:hypothetical protein